MKLKTKMQGNHNNALQGSSLSCADKQHRSSEIAQLKSRSLSHLTWQEYHSYAKKEGIIIIPIGAFEQHGPHLPIATDALLARAFASLVAENLEIYTLEPITHGMRSDLYSGGGETFPGTCSLQPTTFLNLMNDLLDELCSDGFRRIILLNAHYENSPLLREASRQLVKKYHNAKIFFCSWWDMLSREKINVLFPFGLPGMELEHAGILETSVMLYFYPELVRDPSFFPKEVVSPPGFEIYPETLNQAISSSGSLAPAHQATKDAGEKIVYEVLRKMTSAITSCFNIEREFEPG